MWMLYLFLEAAFWPFIALRRALKGAPRRPRTIKEKGLPQWLYLLGNWIKATLIIVLGIPVWILGYTMIIFVARERLNLVNDSVFISGTGSMYPTFPKGHGMTPAELSNEVVASPGMQRYPRGFTLWGRKFFDYEITRGDIVLFTNSKTEEITARDGDPTGFVKRVVAVAGDTIEVRDGILYLNGSAQKEPYVARAQSTFGGTFLPDCREYTVPDNGVFVMGDNRKGSLDSRDELGLVNMGDITHVIPLIKQRGVLDENWHDPNDDLEDSSKIVLDKKAYLELLNEQRKLAGAEPLKYQIELERSAKIRGETILKFDDMSFEATRSGVTMEKAMERVGYSNIVWGESPNYGHYESDELLENQLAFPTAKQFLLNTEFQEIGVSEVDLEIEGCPKHVVVQHFAGYKPPNYEKETIASWRNLVVSLQRIQPSWQNLKNYPEYYSEHRQEIDRINEIIELRIRNAQSIVARMEANEWLTDVEKSRVEQDVGLGVEQSRLAEVLNRT